MATNTATVQAYLSFLNGTTGATATQQLAAVALQVVGNHFCNSDFNVPTTLGGTAIPMGGVAPGGLFFIANGDPVNYVDVLNAVGGTPFLRLRPGEIALGRFHPNVTAPAALANGAPLDISYLFIDP